MDARFYSSAEWRALREQARARDANRCTVSRLLGGQCHGRLHAHHIDRDGDPLDLDNVGTTCAHHHPRWEALRRSLTTVREPVRWRRCPHSHRYPSGREACERRLNRDLLAA